MFGFLAISYYFLHWSKILYEFFMSDMILRELQKMTRKPQKDN